MSHQPVLLDKNYSRAEQILHMVAGYVKEPYSLWAQIRKPMEKRELLSRRIMLSDTWPTATICQNPNHPYGEHLFFYGTPEVYVRSGQLLSGPEIIRGVACYEEQAGLIWYSRPKARHSNLMAVMFEYGVPMQLRGASEQGFLTSRGRFVSREEAVEIARTHFQLIKKTKPEYQLFSEDLFEGSIDQRWLAQRAAEEQFKQTLDQTGVTRGSSTTLGIHNGNKFERQHLQDGQSTHR